MRHMTHGFGALALASLLTVGCSSGTGSNSSENSGTTTADSATLAALALQCAPSTAQLDACSGSAAGASCTLSGKHDGGWTWPGTCRATVDGTAVACVPNPPAPPSALVNACTGKTAGAACEAQGRFGRNFEGTCLTAPGDATLFCGRVHTPPPATVDACSGKAAGDACSRPEWWDAGTNAGICRLGPADAGPLACRPAESAGVAACTGLDAGAACAFGFGHHRGWGGERWGEDRREDGPSGSCVLPAAGGPATCLVPCAELRHFHGHGLEGHGGGWGGPFGPWGASRPDGGMDSP